MDKNSINIRAAKADFDEGLVFARYLDEAAEGFFSFMLGRRFAEIIGKAFILPGHDYSYENVVFAECDNLIAGMASGFTFEQHSSFSKNALEKAAGAFPLRMITVKFIFSPILRVLDTVGEDDFYLQAIAIDPKNRGQGIGSALMDFSEDRARSNGAKRFSLDVLASNKGAYKLYERRGMTIESQWPKHLTIPKIKLLRMTKELKR